MTITLFGLASFSCMQLDNWAQSDICIKSSFKKNTQKKKHILKKYPLFCPKVDSGSICSEKLSKLVYFSKLVYTSGWYAAKLVEGMQSV